MDDIHEQGGPSMTVGVELGEYMLGVREGLQQMSKQYVRHRRGAQVTGSPFVLHHEQDFD